MAALTREEVDQLVAWFETAELPAPPFRTTPWSEIHEPEAWRAIMLRDLRAGPGNVYWSHVVTDLRWLARRIAPPEVQAVAHVDQLAEQHERPF